MTPWVMMILTAQSNPYIRNGRPVKDKNSSHDRGRAKIPGTLEWLGVDGEGVTMGSEHRYVLLGVGDEQIDDPTGLYWRDVFEFLYSFRKNKRALAGFYLNYDFTQWIKTMPAERAWKLLTIEGKESRRSKSPKMVGRFLPVDLDGWQVDMIGQKRLSLRPKTCECLTFSCPHKSAPWLHICDAGPFFQTSFLNVINPKNWENPVVTDEEYATILQGKALRSTAILDSDMRRYNILENVVLARVLSDLDSGFRKLDVALSPGQWYGPGQASQQWLKGRAPKRTDVTDVTPEWFSDAARKSYFGGWFEIMAHGIIPGTSWEYDINSAYPHIISELPCLLHGNYEQGHGNPPKNTAARTLVKATVWTSPPHTSSDSPIGAMLHRNEHGRISRPLVTAGWYWEHELEAATRAKLVTRSWRSNVTEWVRYHPCDCRPPVWQAKNLYQMRLDVGKKSSLGKSSKLVNNSGYGKFAQSVGSPHFANPVYASLITSGCRTMIYDAIATHPGGKNNVLMVATDGVYFLDRHPSLVLSDQLGDWEGEPRNNLTLFKPGVYWDDVARGAIALGEAAAFKARGVNAREFSASIAEIDDKFRLWQNGGKLDWPNVSFKSSFNMVTALQAQTRGKWELAGTIDTNRLLIQSAEPADKRDGSSLYRDEHDGRQFFRTRPLPYGSNSTVRMGHNVRDWTELVEDYSSVSYEKRFGMDDPYSDEFKSQLGTNGDEESPMISAFRLLTGQES